MIAHDRRIKRIFYAHNNNEEKKQSEWIGSIKCKENHNLSWIKRRCSESLYLANVFHPSSSSLRCTLCSLSWSAYEQMSTFLNFFLFFLSFSTGVFLLFLYTVYMSYPLFQLLVVLCLIPFVHYHPVGLCRLCNRLQYTHKVVWRDCRLSISLWKGSFELWMPQRMYSTQIANARTKIHFFENY